MKKLSVIIATRNRPRVLPRAVESARRAGAEVEIVVVDDASTEETQEVCRHLSGINYVRAERRQGLGGARNLGIVASEGEYLSFLDDDDVRLPGSLDLQLEALESAPEAGFVYGQASVGDQDCVPTGEVYPRHCPRGDVFWELLAQNFVPCPSVIFRRSCLYRVGLLDDQSPVIEDWDLWVRIAELYPVIALERPVVVWRRSTPTSGQLTSQPVEMVRHSTRHFQRRWLTLPRATNAPARVRREAKRQFSINMSKHLMWQAACSLKEGQVSSARQNALAALCLHPLGVARAAASASTFRFLFAKVSGKSRGAAGSSAYFTGEQVGDKE